MNYLVTISILFVIYMCKDMLYNLKKGLGRLNIVKIYFTFQCYLSSTSKLKLQILDFVSF